jgi:hypothetical protein
MSNSSHDLQTDDPTTPGLGPWERCGVDSTGQPIIEWDEDAHAVWCSIWAPPCPDGYQQRLRRAVAFRERNVSELELRVPLSEAENGACQVIVEELEDKIRVRVLVCFEPQADVFSPPRHITNCPVRTWLDRPLGNRAVVDVDSEEELPLHTPGDLNNRP